MLPLRQAAEQALLIARDGVAVASDGGRIAVQADTLCVHGDTPGAVAIAAAVAEELRAARFRIAPVNGP